MQDTTTKPSADCGMDHEVLAANANVTQKCKKITTKPVRHDVEEMEERFSIEMESHFKLFPMNIKETESDDIANEAQKIFS